MLACEKLGRECAAMDISPQYIAVALQRMQDAGCTCTLVGGRKGRKTVGQKT